MLITPKLSHEKQIPAAVLEIFIFYRIELKYVQKIQKPGPSRALFTTVYLYVK